MFGGGTAKRMREAQERAKHEAEELEVLLSQARRISLNGRGRKSEGRESKQELVDQVGDARRKEGG